MSCVCNGKNCTAVSTDQALALQGGIIESGHLSSQASIVTTAFTGYLIGIDEGTAFVNSTEISCEMFHLLSPLARKTCDHDFGKQLKILVSLFKTYLCCAADTSNLVVALPTLMLA